MSGDNKSFSESLVLDDSEKGVVITGITDDKVAAKSGLQAGDEIVAATIHLDHLKKNEVLKILKVLEPYDDNMKVLTKKELSTSAGFDSLGLGLKGPAEVLNLKKDLSVDASAESPFVSLDGKTGKLSSEINGPTLNGALPNLSLNNSSADAGAKFAIPSVGLTGPDMKGGLDGTLKAPDVSVLTPQLNTPSASLNLKNPKVKTDKLIYNTPKFAMPQFDLPQLKTTKAEMNVPGDVDLPSVSGNLATPDINLSAPKIKSPDLDFSGPKVGMNTPHVNLENPDLDMETHSGKFKWPHLKWKGPKAKVPDADLNADLSAPKASLSTPKIEGDLDTPNIDLKIPKADIKVPDLDVQAPNLDNDAPSTKIHWPHLKWKKPKIHGPKTDVDLDANLNTPDVSVPKGEINAPDIDINLPKAELKGPDLDMPAQNIDVEAPSGKINWPHLKWKKPRGPKASLDMDADLNTPNLNLSAPKIGGDINDINLPKADLGGGVDVQAPDIDSPKINWPHLKWKKPKLHGPKADMDLNADLSTPDIDLSVPKIDGDLSTLDVKTPNANIETPSGKLKWPTLKKPKWSASGPKVNGPDIDANISAPDLSLSTPTIDGDINVPDADLHLPKADLEGPKVDINAPDIEGPSGKFKWFNFKKPKFGTLKGPRANIDADVKVPDGHIKGPDLNASDFNLSAPKFKGGVDAPDLNVKGPDMDAPELPDGKLFSSFKLPTFKGPKVKVPEMDADIEANSNVDLKAPSLSVSAPKAEGVFDAPDLGIDVPRHNLKGPTVDLRAPHFDASLPKADLLNLKAPDLSLSSPQKMNGNLSAPNIVTKLPNTELEAPGVSLKPPNLDINTPKADLKGPGAQLKTPNLDFDPHLGDFKLPHFKHPKLDLQSPEAEVPSFHPSVKSGIEEPKVNIGIPAADANMSVPAIDLNSPKAEQDVNGPKINMKAPHVDANPELSKLPQLPKFNFSGSKIKAPEVNTSTNLEIIPDIKVNDPSVNGQIISPHAPEVKTSLNSPELEITASPKSKRRWPFRWGLKSGSGTDEEGRGAESETDVANGEVEVPAFKFHRLPGLCIDSPGGTGDTFSTSKHDTEQKDYVVSKGIRLPIVNATTNAGEKVDILQRLKIAKEKAPSVNFSPTEAKGDIDLKLAAPSLDGTASTEAEDSSLVRGGTFKVEKPDPVSDLVAPKISTSDENDKLSLSLSNMLGLNLKDSDAD